MSASSKQWCQEPASMLGLTFPTIQDSKKDTDMSPAEAASDKNGELEACHKKCDVRREHGENWFVGFLSKFGLLNRGSRTSCRRKFSCILFTINFQGLKPVNSMFNWWKMFALKDGVGWTFLTCCNGISDCTGSNHYGIEIPESNRWKQPGTPGHIRPLLVLRMLYAWASCAVRPVTE